jgi:hypothetical protein
LNCDGSTIAQFEKVRDDPFYGLSYDFAHEVKHQHYSCNFFNNLPKWLNPGTNVECSLQMNFELNCNFLVDIKEEVVLIEDFNNVFRGGGSQGSTKRAL